MPFCQNADCGKTGLKKDQVVFDEESHRVLCVPCGQKIAKMDNQALVGELVDKTWFGISYQSDEGLRAEVIHGGVKFAVNVSNDQMKKLIEP